jgi:hypothetical protein
MTAVAFQHAHKINDDLLGRERRLHLANAVDDHTLTIAMRATVGATLVVRLTTSAVVKPEEEHGTDGEEGEEAHPRGAECAPRPGCLIICSRPIFRPSH